MKKLGQTRSSRRAEKIFRIVSIVITVGCILFYGGRFVFYYMKYSKKTTTTSTTYIASTIKNKTGVVYEGDGLHLVNSDYVFKGDVKDNYVTFSNLVWRVIKLNEDGTVKLMLDTSNVVKVFNTAVGTYKDSIVYDYLNNEFYPKLEDADKYLTTMNLCLDKVTGVKEVECKEKLENQKVGLLTVAEFYSSLNKKTYIKSNEAFWLNDVADSNKVWVAYNDKFASVAYNEHYSIRPVVTLDSKVIVESGEGTETDPYKLGV